MIKQIYDILIKEIKLRKRQREIFKKVQIGDMLWCSMPLSRRKFKMIEISHRIRPYLVVMKKKNYLLCYQSSSKKRGQLNNYEKYCVSSGKYRNKKSNWLDLTNINKIKIKNIQLEFFKLNQIDIKKIEKRICIGQNKGNIELVRFNEPIYIEEGDVITKDKKSYYVYAADSINIYCFKIQRRKNENLKLEKIKINTKTYYTNFKDLKIFKRTEEVKITNIAYKDEILLILEQKKWIKANTYSKVKENIKREINDFEIGSVFEYGNSKVMYLYSKDNKYYGVDLLWYLIKPRIFEIKRIHRRKLIETKGLEEINKILGFLIERKLNNIDIEKIYQYVRNLLFSSVVN